MFLPLRFLPTDSAMRRAWLSYMLGLLAIAAMFLVVTFTAPAHAQTSAEVAASWLNSPMVALLFDGLVTIFGPLLVALVLAVLARLYGLLGLQQTAETRATVEQVLQRSLALARVRLGLAPGQHITAQLQGQALSIAAAYALERGPEALAAVGVKPLSGQRPEEVVALREMLTSRLADSAKTSIAEPNDKPATIDPVARL